MKNQLTGMLLIVLSVSLTASAATLELFDDFSGAALDAARWDVTGENGSVTIAGGQMRCRTDSDATPPVYGYAYGKIKRGGTTELSLSMFEGNEFTLALDFQASNATTNLYGTGVRLKLADGTLMGGVMNGLNVYGTYQTGLVGNMASDYIYNAFPAFGHYHAEFTISVGAASMKLYDFDAAATSPADYVSKTPVVEWTLSKADQPVLASIDEKFEVVLAGTASNEANTISEAHFDNIYVSVPEPATMGLLCVGVVGMVLKRRRLG